MASPKVLGINGMGRIGKLTLWHHVARGYFDRIVVNLGRPVGRGLADIAQTIEKDSTYGLLHRFLYGHRAEPLIEVVDEETGQLRVDGRPVTVLREARNPARVAWQAHGAQVVVDTTGRFRDPRLPADSPGGALRGHLEAGARLVIASAPFKIPSPAMPDDAAMLIYGINHTAFNPTRTQILSAASCTTTGLAHMVKPLLEHKLTNQILTASMSTVHAATNTQSTLDTVPKSDSGELRKNRSMLDNIILTSTGAALALEQVIPEVREIGFMADSVRVPIQTESLIILNCTFSSQLDQRGDSLINRQLLLDIYRDSAQGAQKGLLRLDMEQNVSSDLVGVDAAVVIEGQATHTRTGVITLDLQHIQGIPDQAGQESEIRIPVTHAKIFGWYDNEYGSYVNRMGDLTCYAHGQLW
ncbi:MAG: Glyceraldehyde-3-phosphate dehydrogenase 1 [Chloroflexi bacterium]|nr:Glyceraldehyde-3-phosphate dehydrogenase 1 [Chloroflexota bacterium]